VDAPMIRPQRTAHHSAFPNRGVVSNGGSIGKSAVCAVCAVVSGTDGIRGLTADDINGEDRAVLRALLNALKKHLAQRGHAGFSPYGSWGTDRWPTSVCNLIKNLKGGYRARAQQSLVRRDKMPSVDAGLMRSSRSLLEPVSPTPRDFFQNKKRGAYFR